jgi:hypothetical protein
MTHKIDHDDLTTRSWICTECGSTCLSKNPWRRNTHGEGPGGLLDSMYLSALQNQSLVRMVPAYPARPKEEAMVFWSESPLIDRNAPFCYVGRDKDLQIMVTPDIAIQDTGTPLKSDAEHLLQFFKLIRAVSEDVLRSYACSQFGGHEWTDDPALIAERKKVAPEPVQA